MRLFIFLFLMFLPTSYAGIVSGPTSPLTTKGDIFMFGDNGTTRFPVGAAPNSSCLQVDNTQVTGWVIGSCAGPGVISAVTASSPLQSTGGLTPNISFLNQSANIVLSGPSSGGAAAPTFRALVANDIPALSYVSSVGASSPLSSTGGLTPSISCQASSGSQAGCLSSADWTTFNNKQPAGNYISALTGDLSASGPGSVAATLATVNSNTGSFGSSTAIPSFTVNGKGLITAASTNAVIAPAGTLTGTTIASNVVTSSLTAIGSSASIVTHTGGLNVTTRTITTDLTVDTTTTDYLILCNFSAGHNVTLPTPTAGRYLIIKDISGTAQTNNITVVRHASEKIEGVTSSLVLAANWGVWHFSSDGTDWYLVN